MLSNDFFPAKHRILFRFQIHRDERSALVIPARELAIVNASASEPCLELLDALTAHAALNDEPLACWPAAAANIILAGLAATARSTRTERRKGKIYSSKDRYRMSDLIGRAILIAIFSSLATIKALVVFDFAWRRFPADEIHVYLDFASQVAGLAFMIFITLLTLVRLKPIESSQGWEPRVSALIGSFLTFLLPLLPQTEMSRSLQIVSFALVLFGLSASVFVVLWLGRVFSVVPQARRLVVSGPYAVVRHPLYLTEEIAVVGLLMNYMSLEAFAIGAIQWAFQLRRMANEERVLRSTFPEYADYATRTPTLIPRQLRQIFEIWPRKLERPAA